MLTPTLDDHLDDRKSSPLRGTVILVADDASVLARLAAMTFDDGSGIIGSVGVLVTEKIGPKRSFTPEGYLYCQDVRISRVGEQLYGPGETPLVVGDQGYLIIERSEAEVFRPEFVASFEGKPVTNDHPKTRDGVHAGNFRKYAVGTTLNPRRGEGADKDYMVADLMITDATAIQDVMSGKREVSAGYAAEYIQTGAGRGQQKNMVGNHVALVKVARCGPSCSIGDAANPSPQEIEMRQHTNDSQTQTLDAKHPLMKLWQAVRDALKTKDETAIEAAVAAAMPTAQLVTDCGMMAEDAAARGRLKAVEDRLLTVDTRLAAFDAYVSKNPTKDAASTTTIVVDAALKAVQDALAEEAPQGVAEKARIATDSEFLHEAFQEAVAGAEILVPGISLPKYTRDAKPGETLHEIVKLRRHALELVSSMPQGREFIERLNGGRKLSFDAITQAEGRSIFRAAVVARKTSIQTDTRTAADAAARAAAAAGQGRKQPVRSIKEMNERFSKHYGAPQQH